MRFQGKSNGLNQYFSWENSYAEPPQHWGTTTNYDDDVGGEWGGRRSARFTYRGLRGGVGEGVPVAGEGVGVGVFAARRALRSLSNCSTVPFAMR
jgi:hypothetical protein